MNRRNPPPMQGRGPVPRGPPSLMARNGRGRVPFLGHGMIPPPPPGRGTMPVNPRGGPPPTTIMDGRSGRGPFMSRGGGPPHPTRGGLLPGRAPPPPPLPSMRGNVMRAPHGQFVGRGRRPPLPPPPPPPPAPPVRMPPMGQRGGLAIRPSVHGRTGMAPPSQHTTNMIPHSRTVIQQHVPPPKPILPAQQPQPVIAHSYLAQHQHQVDTAAPTSYTKEHIDQAWSEHTAPNGMKYYYNAITKESTYHRPDALKQKDVNNTWNEYKDPTTGKTYYSNGVTTTWEKPDAFAQPNEPEEQSSEQPAKKKKKVKRETEFNNKEEAIAAFKGLLLAKNVSPTQKWTEVIKMCSTDTRWDDCEDVLTIGERKQALAEYQTKRANELRIQDRQEKQRVRDAFAQLLADSLPKLGEFSQWQGNFDRVRDKLAKDDRYHAVADEATRETLFYDFCEEFRKREERKKRSKKRQAHDDFVSFLEEKEDIGKITFASTWNSFVSSLDEDERKDQRFSVSAYISEDDRQVLFADFVIKLQTDEEDKRNRIRDAKRRAELAQREAYEKMLGRLANDEKLLPSSHWRDLESIIQTEPSYSSVREQDPETPRELFEKFLREWTENYRYDRAILMQIMRSGPSVHIDEDTTFDNFTRDLSEAVRDSPELKSELRRAINRFPLSSVKLYFKELRGQGSVVVNRRLNARRKDESSEDEGEIVEDESNEI